MFSTTLGNDEFGPLDTIMIKKEVKNDVNVPIDPNKEPQNLNYHCDFPIINVITRTSNRPNDFKKNREWLLNQTYKNVRHIVSCDDPGSLGYIKEHGCDVLVEIDRDVLIARGRSPDPNTGSYSLHNLYMNECHKHVKDGWILYIDDDDRFYTHDALQQIVDTIRSVDVDTIIYWQIYIRSYATIPIIIDDFHPPRMRQISSQCFAFHHKYKDVAKWDDWKCGDFRFVNQLHSIIKKHIFIKKPLVFTPRDNGGNRKDNNLED